MKCCSAYRCLGMVVALLVMALVPTVASAASWTVLIYLNADNNLEYFGLLDMNEMEMAPANVNVNVVVQMDRIPGDDSSDGNWTDTRRYLIKHDTNPSVIASQRLDSPPLGELDMGDPAVLVDFVEWGMQHYPADHYLLDIWDHGSGWKTMELKEPLKGISYDDTSGTNISTAQLGAALRQIASDTGKVLDIVSADACLMAMAEIAYEIRGGADYWLTSEETIPGYGFAYDQYLTALANNPSMSPVQLCQTLVQTYNDSYNGGSQGYADVCLSAIDVSKMDGVEAAVDSFAVAATNALGTNCDELMMALWQSQGYFYPDYRDLYDMASRVRSGVNDTGLQGTADDVMAAVTAAVVANGYVGSYLAGSHGISIYYPNATDYMSSYGNLAFAVQSHWDEFISTVPPCNSGFVDKYEPDDIPEQASTILSGHMQIGHWFDDPYDLDWVTFTMNTGRPYVIQTMNLGSQCDTWIFLFDTSIVTDPDNAVPLADNDDIEYPVNLASRIRYQPQVSGTYYLAVFGWGYSGPGTTYDLLFSEISFMDVAPENPLFGYVETCVTADIVQGYWDNNYHPERTVKRDQMAVFIARALTGGSVPAPAPGTQSFSDVPYTGHGDSGTHPYWAYNEIEYCKARGVVQGYADGLYHPEREVNRGNMAVFIARAMANPVGEAGLAGFMPPATPTFPDVTLTSEWASVLRYVEYLASLGIVQGYETGYYHPERIVNRGQMAIYIARAFGLAQ